MPQQRNFINTPGSPLPPWRPDSQQDSSLVHISGKPSPGAVHGEQATQRNRAESRAYLPTYLASQTTSSLLRCQIAHRKPQKMHALQAPEMTLRFNVSIHSLMVLF